MQRGQARESTGGAGVTPSFSVAGDGDQLAVFDPIERCRAVFRVPGAVSPVPASTDSFRFPVDAAVRIRADGLTIPTVTTVAVRDADGEMVARTNHSAYETLPEGTYSLEISDEIKFYLRLSGAVTVVADTEQTHILLEEDTEVLIGARSLHEQPAATITTPPDPASMMAVVSTFGSALKTTSPERSFPTLRGHPPTVELGDELDVPAGIEAPDTGVEIAVPADFEHLYVVAPLAFYLGATVVEGSTPRIQTDTGFTHQLRGERDFEAEVERVLKQAFLFDCVTRTEGFFPVDLAERREVEAALPADPADLYDRSLPEQLAAYLEVPYEAVRGAVPRWKLTAHVQPRPDSVEMLPFVMNDLGVVRTPEQPQTVDAPAEASAIEEFVRSGEDFTRSATTRSASDTRPSGRYVAVEETGALEQLWVGEGRSTTANKALLSAFRNRLEREPKADDIEVTVVCNDPEMVAERDAVNSVYGSREDFPLEVGIAHELSVEELAAVLESETDFLHYVGHIDGDGFECTDGKLDVASLDRVGPDTFFLNACQSYDQGLELVEGGAIAGVVTTSDVINSGAVRVGSAMARLLNRGFPFRSALSIAGDQSIMGTHYTVIGDGGLAIAQAESGHPYEVLLSPGDRGDAYETYIKTYPRRKHALGSLFTPHVNDEGTFYLGSSKLTTFTLGRDDLRQYLSMENVPVQVDGELHWSDDLGPADL